MAVLVGILDVGFLATAILVTRLALQGELRTNALGFICAGLSVVTYASPLSAIVILFSHLCCFPSGYSFRFCFLILF